MEAGVTDTQIRDRINKSSHDFLKIAWPHVGEGFGDPVPVESVTDNYFAKELDARAGIDMWVISVDGHMRGLASRVQWPNHSYDTFTVRIRNSSGTPTEYHKRKAELQAHGAIRPHYFCHAYVSRDRTRLLAAALALTIDVIAAVDLQLGRPLPPNSDGSQGYAIPWERLADSGASIRIYRGDGTT